jgi:hypothetical protein
MTTSFLNLDEISSPTRTVTIGGVEYEVVTMTVENFIETTKATKTEGLTESEQMERMVEMVGRYIPEIDKNILNKLPIEKITVLLEFVTGAMDAKEEPEAEAEGDAKGGKEPKKT